MIESISNISSNGNNLDDPTINIGILWLNCGVVIHASDACSHLLGLTREALIGQDFVQIVEAHDSDGLKAWLYAQQEDSHSENAFTLLLKNRPPLRLSTSHTERNENLRVIVLTPTSLWELAKNMDGTLKEFLNGDPVPTFVLNTDHTILHWNRACETIIGMRAEEMVGTKNQWRAFYPGANPRPTLADLVIDSADTATARNWYGDKIRPSDVVPHAFEAEDFFPHMGGSGRWLLFTATPIRATNGRLIGAIETLVDITELKRAEEELRNYHHEIEALTSRQDSTDFAGAAINMPLNKALSHLDELTQRLTAFSTSANLELNSAMAQSMLQLIKASQEEIAHAIQLNAPDTKV